MSSDIVEILSGKRELMDSSLKSAHSTTDELDTSLAAQHEEAEETEGHHHIHLPNPSFWPLVLSVAILLAVIGLLFIPDAPWLTIAGAILILASIVAWGLEDPLAPLKVRYRTVANIPSQFQLGQTVVGSDGRVIGTVEARFKHYILVESGGLFGKVYYVPHGLAQDVIKDDTIHLTVNEGDLLKRNLDVLPADLYEDAPDTGLPSLKGVPLFARGPLSPAETGHYNYGPNYPGINTDASGSYHPEEVVPRPQRYVGERRRLYATNRPVPSRAVSSN